MENLSLIYYWQMPLLFVVGIVAGILNVLAGGGSLLTLPLLIFMGLGSTVANGTNRIAILFQDLFAVIGFKKRGVLPVDLALLCTPPALIGSWFGASLAVSMDDVVFNRILAGIMIGVLIFTAVDPMKRIRQQDIAFSTARKIVLAVSFFFCGNVRRVCPGRCGVYHHCRIAGPWHGSGAHQCGQSLCDFCVYGRCSICVYLSR
nr:sulfite exporter TauE/SafE family protein [uncultured Desulfobacter sp.]